MKRANIQRDIVVSAALTLLDEAGIEGLTMRRLAEKLDVQAPSLYWHFPGKKALLDAMADALLENVARGMELGEPWPVRVQCLGTEIRRALLARRDGARVFLGTYVATDNVLRVAEAILGPLRTAGASAQTAAWGTWSIIYYVLGFVIEEQAAAELGVEIKRLHGPVTRLAEAGYPNVRAVLSELLSQDFDARFSTGLGFLITGIQVKIAEQA